MRSESPGMDESSRASWRCESGPRAALDAVDQSEPCGESSYGVAEVDANGMVVVVQVMRVEAQSPLAHKLM